MEKKFEIRNMLFLDKERQTNIDIDGNKFVIKAIFPVDRKEIARRVALDQGGINASAFSMSDRMIMERSATIDNCLIEYPEWWKSTDECPDEQLLDDIYKSIIEWTDEFSEKLKKNKLTKRSERSALSS